MNDGISCSNFAFDSRGQSLFTCYFSASHWNSWYSRIIYLYTRVVLCINKTCLFTPSKEDVVSDVFHDMRW